MSNLFITNYNAVPLEANALAAKTAAEAVKTYQESATTGLPKLLAELLAVKAFIDTEIAAIVSYTDTLETSLANTTYGLSAIKTKLDLVGVDATAIKAYTDLIDDATNGLTAIKTAVNTVNTTLANATYGLSAIDTQLGVIEAKTAHVYQNAANNTTTVSVTLPNLGMYFLILSDGSNPTVSYYCWYHCGSVVTTATPIGLNELNGSKTGNKVISGIIRGVYKIA